MSNPVKYPGILHNFEFYNIQNELSACVTDKSTGLAAFIQKVSLPIIQQKVIEINQALALGYYPLLDNNQIIFQMGLAGGMHKTSTSSSPENIWAAPLTQIDVHQLEKNATPKMVQLKSGVVAVAIDNTIKIWNPDGRMQELHAKEAGSIQTIVGLSDGTLVTGHGKGICILWDVVNGVIQQQIIATKTFEGKEELVIASILERKDGLLAILLRMKQGGKVILVPEIWDRSGKLIAPGKIPDSKKIDNFGYVLTYNKALLFWETEQGGLVAVCDTQSNGSRYKFIFWDSDGTFINDIELDGSTIDGGFCCNLGQGIIAVRAYVEGGLLSKKKFVKWKYEGWGENRRREESINEVQLVNGQGKIVKTIKLETRATGIQALNDGNLLIGTSDNILIWSREGKLLREFSPFADPSLKTHWTFYTALPYELSNGEIVVTVEEEKKYPERQGVLVCLNRSSGGIKKVPIQSSANWSNYNRAIKDNILELNDGSLLVRYGTDQTSCIIMNRVGQTYNSFFSGKDMVFELSPGKLIGISSKMSQDKSGEKEMTSISIWQSEKTRQSFLPSSASGAVKPPQPSVSPQLESNTQPSIPQSFNRTGNGRISQIPSNLTTSQPSPPQPLSWIEAGGAPQLSSNSITRQPLNPPSLNKAETGRTSQSPSYPVFAQAPQTTQTPPNPYFEVLLQEVKLQHAQGRETASETLQAISNRNDREENVRLTAQITHLQAQINSERSAASIEALQRQMQLLLAGQDQLLAEQSVKIQRREAATAFQASPNLWTHYRILYIQLEEIFIGCKAVASEFIKTDLTGSLSTAGDVLSWAKKLSSLVPVIGDAVNVVLSAGSSALKAADQKRQTNILKTMSQLGTLSDIKKASEATARLLTEKYREQLEKLPTLENDQQNSDARRLASAFGRAVEGTKAVAQQANAFVFQGQNSSATEEVATYAVSLVVAALLDGTIETSSPLEIQFQAAVTAPPKPFELMKQVILDKLGVGTIRTIDSKVWNKKDLYYKPGIRTADGMLYDGGMSDPSYFGYRLGTEAEAIERGMKKVSKAPATKVVPVKVSSSSPAPLSTPPTPATLHDIDAMRAEQLRMQGLLTKQEEDNRKLIERLKKLEKMVLTDSDQGVQSGNQMQMQSASSAFASPSQRKNEMTTVHQNLAQHNDRLAQLEIILATGGRVVPQSPPASHEKERQELLSPRDNEDPDSLR